MRSLPTTLSGVLLLEPDVVTDPRGFFVETFSRQRYAEVGVGDDFVQDNQSRSGRGTIRGLHFQVQPGQAKLVRVARGRIWDVVVDLRRSSSTFGGYEGFELDDVAHRQVYVPIGFAHGFCVLSELADVAYRVSSYYDADAERGVAWNDPALSIPWPIKDPVLSQRDRSLPRLEEMQNSLPDW
jgi:dTDP-4-dehydrorhamnose 3,5-epimerase